MCHKFFNEKCGGQVHFEARLAAEREDGDDALSPGEGVTLTLQDPK